MGGRLAQRKAQRGGERDQVEESQGQGNQVEARTASAGRVREVRPWPLVQARSSQTRDDLQRLVCHLGPETHPIGQIKAPGGSSSRQRRKGSTEGSTEGSTGRREAGALGHWFEAEACCHDQQLSVQRLGRKYQRILYSVYHIECGGKA